MSKKNNYRFSQILIGLLGFMVIWGGAPNTVSFATDGSGLGTANPSAVIKGSSNNNIDLKYTATEKLGDASVKLTIPFDWPAPTPGNTAVIVQGGFLADILDLVNPPTIGGNNGWEISSSILGLTLGNPSLTPSVSPDSEAQDVLEGTHSLSVKNNIVLGLGLLGLPVLKSDVFRNLTPAQDWSGYQRLSFWIKLDQFLSAGIDLASSDFVVASETGLGGNKVTYDLDNAILRVGVLGSEEWTQVIIDLTKNNSITPPNNVGSFGLSLRTGILGLQLNVLTEANLDCFKIGGDDATPIFNGNMVTAHLISLDNGGMVTFNYDGITAPNTIQQYTFPMQMREDCGGILTNLSPANNPTITTIDLGGGDGGGTDGGGTDGGGTDGGGGGNGGNTISDDADHDGNDEIAVDIDDDNCFGDAFFDPDGSSTVCFNIDGNDDGCEDFFLDIDGDGCLPCPDIYWDPTNGIITPVSFNNDEVCSFSSGGDDGDDSFISPEDGGVGTLVSGSGGCSLDQTSTKNFNQGWMIFPLTLLFLLLKRSVRNHRS